MNQGTAGAQKLRILLVEDSPADAMLARLALTSGLAAGFELTESSRLEQALAALETGAHDVVLLDLGLPDSQGLATFSVLRGRFRSVPVVVLSGVGDDATALVAMRLGAQDYLVKGRFDGDALGRAIRYAIERQRLLQQLERSLAYVRELLLRADGLASIESSEGALAMCAWCKKIRDRSGHWQTIEEFLGPRTDAALTHGACPACAAKIRSEG